jgi:ribonuclease-3
VLGFLISEDLLQRHPEAAEGRLSKLKAHLVSAAWLHEAAQRLRLGEYLELGRGEEMSGGRAKKTLLVDALEALIAAIYLDGGMQPAREFIKRFVVAPGISEPGSMASRFPRTSPTTRARCRSSPRRAACRRRVT